MQLEADELPFSAASIQACWPNLGEIGRQNTELNGGGPAESALGFIDTYH